MNKIQIQNAQITNIHPFHFQKRPGLDVKIRDNDGRHTVFFQLVFYDDAALRVQGHIAEGDFIDVTGNLWVRPHDGHFDIILENPSGIYNHTRSAAVGPVATPQYPAQPVPPEEEDDGLPF